MPFLYIFFFSSQYATYNKGAATFVAAPLIMPLRQLFFHNNTSGFYSFLRAGSRCKPDRSFLLYKYTALLLQQPKPE